MGQLSNRNLAKMKLGLGASLCAVTSALGNPAKPNIPFIFSDDHGFADVSWKNDKVKTPNMDKLRKRGVTIDGSYSQARCTPSRVSLLTGKYPWKIGFNGMVVSELAMGGIRPDEVLMPKYLKDAGYKTYGYGKWHVGYCAAELLPWNRGFDEYYGLMGPGFDYYSHQLQGNADLWHGKADANGGIETEAEEIANELYATDDFTKQAMNVFQTRVEEDTADPFFMYMAYNAPHHPYKFPTHSNLDEFTNLDSDRRMYLATLHRMDVMIGRLVEKLEQTGETDNTIIVFQDDNGPTEGGNAFPLRGKKSVYSEGGVRVPAFIVGPTIPADKEMSRHNYMHLSDWMPTLLEFGGGDPNQNQDWDGVSFKSILENGGQGDPPRQEILHNISTQRQGGIYRKGDFKVAYKRYGDFLGRTGHVQPQEGPCPKLDEDSSYTVDQIMSLSNRLQKETYNGNEILMFNIRDDPYELVNVYKQHTSEGNAMADHIVQMARDYGHIELIETANANDQATLNDPDFPKNTGTTSWGWCDGNSI